MNEGNQFNPSDSSGEHTDGASNIFLNMAETDSATGIPSLKQAPMSAISSSASESKMNTQLVIAACVLAIGGGAIYAMRYIGMKAGLDEKVVEIDYASETSSADFNKRFVTVMKTLDDSTIAVQLSNKDSFAKTPFARPNSVVEDVVPMDPGMSEEERLALQRKRDLEREIERRREMVISEAMRLKLQGIIGGSRPAARVSGQPVRAGMQLGEFFTVTKITGRSMIIEADGMRFELAMGQETVRLD
jgi:hypothetical protein